MRNRGRSLVAAVLAGILGVTAGGVRTAHAEEVSPKGKGIVGGALLGAEVIVTIEALAGVRQGVWYAVGAGVGAAGGGVGGYFIEQESTDGKVPMYMLAGGLALVIPAIVLTLNATRYQPVEGAVEDKTPQAPANPGIPGGGSVVIQGGASTETPSTTPAPTTPAAPAPAPPHVPESLLDVNGNGDNAIRMGVPVPHVGPMWSLREQKLYGVQRGTELRVPVLKVTF